MDARKILQDLPYRINTTQESDPERGNAIRLRDRLLARLGLSLDGAICPVCWRPIHIHEKPH